MSWNFEKTKNFQRICSNICQSSLPQDWKEFAQHLCCETLLRKLNTSNIRQSSKLAQDTFGERWRNVLRMFEYIDPRGYLNIGEFLKVNVFSILASSQKLMCSQYCWVLYQNLDNVLSFLLCNDDNNIQETLPRESTRISKLPLFRWNAFCTFLAEILFLDFWLKAGFRKGSKTLIAKLGQPSWFSEV